MKAFQHQHSAHCESGVASLLFKHQGLEISEPFVFGIGSGLSFSYLPIIKLSGMPLIAYRSMPKSIIKTASKRLGLTLKTQTFSNQKKAEETLDRLLDEGKYVGAQTSVYYLPYFPKDMRFHFNAHNLIVYGKEGDEYLVSDPVFEYTVKIKKEDLLKARFAKGALAPKGLLYYVEGNAAEVDYPKVIKASIKATIKTMNPPVFFAGIKGIKYLAKKVDMLPQKYKDDMRYPKLFLGHIVRMQEEIGTGGAGFRYMYASYLQEASHYTDKALLQEASQMMTEVGDAWRVFAQSTALMCKGREEMNIRKLSTMLHEIAQSESKVYEKLKQIV